MKQKIQDWIKNNELYQVSSVYSKKDKKIKGMILTEAVLRSVAPNEIVIEYDIDLKTRAKFYINKTIKSLNANGYSFAIFDYKSRSPHIHIYNIQGLEEQTEDIRRKYKQFFLNKYAPFTDYSLCSNDHLIALEFKPHFKHGIKKELVKYYGNTSLDNVMEFKLLEKALAYVEKYKNNNEYIDNSGNEWFLRWINEEINDIPTGQRNNILAKNYSILTNKKKELIKKLPKWFQPEVIGWQRWVEEMPRKFSIHEIFRFGDMYGYDIRNVMKKYRRGGSQDDIR